jgi:transposase-like protein
MQLTESTIKCPQCGSEAYNQYGHLKNGKQRYICLVCNRQFVNDHANKPIDRRPLCPTCGRSMHVYMQHPDIVRFRCSQYPDCHGYAKIEKEK